MNQLAEQTVVERATGGKGGGGAQLTHYGQRLIQLYDLLGGAAKAFDVLQQDDLPLDSLLAAISRFRCKPARAISSSAPSSNAIISRCSSTRRFC